MLIMIFIHFFHFLTVFYWREEIWEAQHLNTLNEGHVCGIEIDEVGLHLYDRIVLYPGEDFRNS